VSGIRCFMITDTGRISRRLRRFVWSRDASKCPGPFSYHTAESAVIDDVERDAHDDGEFLAEYDCGNPLWPRTCSCGYVFKPSDQWQCFIETLMRREDNGEIVSLHHPPVGAMWFCTWLKREDGRPWFNPQLGAFPLCVETPGGQWIIDQRASNCTLPDDFNQDRHHCWIAHGVPPNVTVDKNGQTCAAGAGSIQCDSYHGFLRDGYLTQA